MYFCIPTMPTYTCQKINKNLPIENNKHVGLMILTHALRSAIPIVSGVHMIDMNMNVVGLIATAINDINLRKKAVAAAACDKNELIWREMMMMMMIQKQVGAPQIQLIS